MDNGVNILPFFLFTQQALRLLESRTWQVFILLTGELFFDWSRLILVLVKANHDCDDNHSKCF